MLVVGIDSDVYYPLSEQLFIHKYIRGSEMGIVRSLAGHDGFLLEDKQLTAFASDFLRRNSLCSEHKSHL